MGGGRTAGVRRAAGAGWGEAASHGLGAGCGGVASHVQGVVSCWLEHTVLILQYRYQEIQKTVKKYAPWMHIHFNGQE